MSTNVLAARDINTSAPSQGGAQAPEGEKPKSLEYHRQVLQQRMDDSEGNAKYVSPSDNIMSPATAKISAMKSKRFMSAKPQSLFAKTSSKNAAASGLGAEPLAKSKEEKPAEESS